MLIVTQEGTIVNFDSVERIYTEDNEIIAQYISGGCEVLGEYKNRERTIEVLRKIVNAYRKPVGAVSMVTLIVRLNTPVVYVMPEE